MARQEDRNRKHLILILSIFENSTKALDTASVHIPASQYVSTFEWNWIEEAPRSVVVVSIGRGLGVGCEPCCNWVWESTLQVFILYVNPAKGWWQECT